MLCAPCAVRKTFARGRDSCVNALRAWGGAGVAMASMQRPQPGWWDRARAARCERWASRSPSGNLKV